MKGLKRKVKNIISKVLYSIFSILPLSNKVLGSSFYGMEYENNPRFVFEKLQEKYPELKKIWVVNKNAKIELPSYVAPAKGLIRIAYDYATAKVIIDSHFFPRYYKRRKNQFTIFMYHGGIGIKRNSNEVPSRKKTDIPAHNAKNMTLFISNSDFTTRVIRSSLEFQGPVLKCGYPKDDPLFDLQDAYKKRVCEYYGVSIEKKFFMYAPTYRQDRDDHSGFNIDIQSACTALAEKFGGEWMGIVKWHPKQKISTDQSKAMYGESVIDATNYSNMQELIIASDAFVSDYSSCIFEAAERKMPCFSYATDWNTFKHEQGVHFEINELPFPYCRNNNELINAIKGFDTKTYLAELDSFFKQEGLCDTGKASETIADIIYEYTSGNIQIVKKMISEGKA